MTDYTYPARIATLTNHKLLREQIAALPLPGWTDFDRDLAGVLHLRFPADLSPANKTALDSAIAAHDHTQLTAAQQAAATAAADEDTLKANARTAYQAILAAANSTALTAGAMKPILRYLARELS